MPIIGREPADNAGQTKWNASGRYHALDKIAAPFMDIGAIINRQVEKNQRQDEPSQSRLFLSFYLLLPPGK